MRDAITFPGSTEPAGQELGEFAGAVGGLVATGLDELDVAVGRFEACVEHRGPDLDARCAACGWPAADHTAGLAEVVEVRRTVVTTLRRAS